MSHRGQCLIPEAEGRVRPLCRRSTGEIGYVWTVEDEAAERYRIARHEAGHAVVALALGRHVEYVPVIEDDPHVLHHGRADRPGWPHDSLFVLLAGRLGGPEPPPFDHADAGARIAASRTRCLGECDECKAAFYFGALWGTDRTDWELAQCWGHLRGVMVGLLQHSAIAEAIDRIADALVHRPLLLADDLAVIVNATALRAVAAEMMGQGDRQSALRRS